MDVSSIGIIVSLLGLAILFLNRDGLVSFVFFCSLFGGASVFNPPGLGTASILPGTFAIGFLALGQIGRPGGSQKLYQALVDHRALAIYAGWAVAGAYLLPRLFAGRIDLPPMQMKGAYTLFYAAPLGPSTRNFTQAVYIVGTFVAAWVTTAATTGRDCKSIVRFVLWCGLIHVAFGLLDVLLSALGLESALEFFRNGNYAQVDQDIGSFHRIAGVFPETSGYSAFGFFFFVFATELWLRRIDTGLAGFTALALGLILLFTTSSTAYLGLAAFGMMLTARLLIFPHLSAGRLPVMLLFGLSVAVIILSSALFFPEIVRSFVDALASVTINKGGSVSAIQRGYWSQRAFDAFSTSYGMGVGVGSFRSSSLIAAILGSTGVIGAAAFLIYLMRLLHPFNLETYDLNSDTEARSAGAAAAWAATLGLAPASVSAAGADPGLIFGLFAGLAMAWRAVPSGRGAASRAWRPKAEPA